MSDARQNVGTVFGGSYRLTGILGQGGMGTVYAAETASGEAVALKVLHEKAQRDPDLVARFQREAEIAAQIQSPFVARILRAGKEPDGRLWIAFEQLSGEPFDVRLKREQYLTFAEAAPLIDDAFQGLDEAHAAGVIHRDIKPANLFIECLTSARTDLVDGMLDEGPVMERTRILDFGVSKLRSGNSRHEPSLTAIDATLGSFAYMAPEQIRGSARVDERADLYALGAVCFRALAGRLPFEGTNAATLIALKLDRDPPTLHSVTGDDWPAAVEGFLAKIMARDREGRFQSARAALTTFRDVRDVMSNIKPRGATRDLIEESDDRTEVTIGSHIDRPSGRLR
jgi:eukaryotic-like serine/threonine-protein kinase